MPYSRLSLAAQQGILAVCGLATASYVFADDDVQLEEVVVTAQKRSERIQDVPISITALSENRLAELGAVDFQGYSRTVPGLAFSDQGAGRSQITIRGITTGPVRRDDPTKTETVGVYLNEVPVAVALYNPDLDLFDVNRVEVLRGPQGTLYGAGSLSGTIRVITNEPDATQTAGKVEVGTSTTRNGGVGYEAKGAVNAPIIQNQLALRLTGYYDSDGGFINDIGRGLSDVNSDKKYGGRIALLWTPNDHLRIAPLVVLQKITANGFPTVDQFWGINHPPNSDQPIPVGPYTQFRQAREGIVDDFRLLSTQIDYDFSNIRLTSVSSYLDRTVDVRGDFTAFMQSIFVGAPFADDIPPAIVIDHKHPKTFTQELRLTSKEVDPLGWVVGAYYSDQRQQYGQSIPIPGFTAATGLDTASLGTPDNVFESFFNLKIRQYAFFGETTYKLTQELAATAGVRWYDVKERYTHHDQGFVVGRISAIDGAESSESGANPKFLLSYQPSRDLLLSAQASKGFRLGGPNQVLPLSGPTDCTADLVALGLKSAPTAAKSETLWNYELGAKSTLAGGRLTLNGAVYDIEYKDLLVTNSLSCGFVLTQNAGSARSRGGELESTLHVRNHWDVTLAGSYTDATLTSDLPGGSGHNGDRLPFVPQYTLSATSRYTQPLSPNWVGSLEASYQRVGSSQSFFNSGPNQDPQGNTVAPYDIAGIRLGLIHGRWDATLFVDNVFDKRAITSIDRVRPGYAAGGRPLERDVFVIRPRTVGLTLRADF